MGNTTVRNDVIRLRNANSQFTETFSQHHRLCPTLKERKVFPLKSKRKTATASEGVQRGDEADNSYLEQAYIHTYIRVHA